LQSLAEEIHFKIAFGSSQFTASKPQMRVVFESSQKQKLPLLPHEKNARNWQVQMLIL
jgi:hypothetical protein